MRGARMSCDISHESSRPHAAHSHKCHLASWACYSGVVRSRFAETAISTMRKPTIPSSSPPEAPSFWRESERRNPGADPGKRRNQHSRRALSYARRCAVIRALKRRATRERRKFLPQWHGALFENSCFIFASHGVKTGRVVAKISKSLNRLIIGINHREREMRDNKTIPESRAK